MLEQLPTVNIHLNVGYSNVRAGYNTCAHSLNAGGNVYFLCFSSAPR